MSIEAILWDVGGPIIREDEMNPKWEVALIEAATEVSGTSISRETFERINRDTVQSFAPFAFRTIMYRLVGEVDTLYEAGLARFKELIPQYSTEVQPGIRELLAELAERLPMVVVANQSRGLKERLDEIGIGNYFKLILGAGDIGMIKPDTRIFLRALNHLKVEPEHALMVGDRIDNDVVPAKMIGMKTLHLKTGWHADQKPRTPDEQPDWSVESVEQMISTLHDLTNK
jgi:HAD superfamily hydrolase (TIGR01549 family)